MRIASVLAACSLVVVGSAPIAATDLETLRGALRNAERVARTGGFPSFQDHQVRFGEDLAGFERWFEVGPGGGFTVVALTGHPRGGVLLLFGPKGSFVAKESFDAVLSVGVRELTGDSIGEVVAEVRTGYGTGSIEDDLVVMEVSEGRFSPIWRGVAARHTEVEGVPRHELAGAMLFPIAWEGGSTPDMIHVVHDLLTGSWKARLFDVQGRALRARTEPPPDPGARERRPSPAAARSPGPTTP